jgi:hypothetical protein
MQSKEKICAKCGATKPLYEFYPSPRNRGGRSTCCKDCNKERATQWARANPIRRKKNKETREGAHPFKYWAQSTLKTHREKGLSVNLSAHDLITLAAKSPKCLLCECALDWTRSNGRLSSKNWVTKPSLDRVNNDTFLNKDNVMLICCRCNRMKGKLTLAKFVQHCKNILSHGITNDNM